jgi:multiple sugar transport system permease protein
MSTATLDTPAPIRARRARRHDFVGEVGARAGRSLFADLSGVRHLPVGYGLWLARHPESYVRLFADPIFFRTLINTVVFIVVAVNIKMVMRCSCRAFS